MKNIHLIHYHMKRSISPFVPATFLWAGYSEALEDMLLEAKYMDENYEIKESSINKEDASE
jgi:hypothetical protein